MIRRGKLGGRKRRRPERRDESESQEADRNLFSRDRFYSGFFQDRDGLQYVWRSDQHDCSFVDDAAGTRRQDQ